MGRFICYDHYPNFLVSTCEYILCLKKIDGKPEENYFYQSCKEKGSGSTRQAILFPYNFFPNFLEELNVNVKCERVMSDKATIL